MEKASICEGTFGDCFLDRTVLSIHIHSTPFVVFLCLYPQNVCKHHPTIRGSDGRKSVRTTSTLESFTTHYFFHRWNSAVIEIGCKTGNKTYLWVTVGFVSAELVIVQYHIFDGGAKVEPKWKILMTFFWQMGSKVRKCRANTGPFGKHLSSISLLSGDQKFFCYEGHRPYIRVER